MLAINWGRQWACAGLDNAQLQALTFTRRPDGPTLEFKPESKLFADDTYGNAAVLVEPGVWDLTGFDVKVAESMEDDTTLEDTVANMRCHHENNPLVAH